LGPVPWRTFKRPAGSRQSRQNIKKEDLNNDAPNLWGVYDERRLTLQLIIAIIRLAIQNYGKRGEVDA